MSRVNNYEDEAAGGGRPCDPSLQMTMGVLVYVECAYVCMHPRILERMNSGGGFGEGSGWRGGALRLASGWVAVGQVLRDRYNTGAKVFVI